MASANCIFLNLFKRIAMNENELLNRVNYDIAVLFLCDLYPHF